MISDKTYYIFKGKTSAPIYLTNEYKWTNNLNKAMPFINEDMATEILKQSKKRTGSVGYWLGETIITARGCEYDSNFLKV